MRDFNSRRVLFDTNAIMDAADDSRPGSDKACQALRYCNGGGDRGLVTAESLKDAYYSFRKAYGEPWARNAIKTLLDLLVILPLGGEATLVAVDSDEPDFEDGLVRAAAELNDVDFILTHDKAAFRNSPIRAVTCAEYVEIAAASDRKARKDLKANAQ